MASREDTRRRPRRGEGPEPAGPAQGASPALGAPLTEPALVFSRKAVREVDRLAVEQYGIPSILLMENAAIGLTDAALGMLTDTRHARVLVYCGPGNNGGDGLAAARHLANAGLAVTVALAVPAEAYTGDPAVYLRIVRAMEIPIIDLARPDAPAVDLGLPDLVVDALLGTGLDRPVRGPMAAHIASINALGNAGAAVLAADLPSGLDADTGQGLGEGGDAAVRADVTVSFVGIKKGFLALSAQEFIGRVIVAPIGAPMELVRRLGEPLAEPARPGDSSRAERTAHRRPGPGASRT